MKKRVVTFLIVFALTIGVATASTGSKTLTASYNNIKITIDGQAITPKNAGGEVVEPFIVDGTTYLPVRAVAEALGKEVAWDASISTVMITTPDAPTGTSITLGAGQYVVGEDISAGKYDCVAVSGSGNFMGSVAALGIMGLNEILGAPGTLWEGTPSYSNLRLANGDSIKISGDLKVSFTAK